MFMTTRLGFAMCTHDLEFCPNDECDGLEKLSNSCPWDCDFKGELSESYELSAVSLTLFSFLPQRRTFTVVYSWANRRPKPMPRPSSISTRRTKYAVVLTTTFVLAPTMLTPCQGWKKRRQITSRIVRTMTRQFVFTSDTIFL